MLIHFTFSIALLNMTSMKAGRVVLSLYALRLGAQPATIGLLASTFSVFPVLLSYQTGKLCDRFGARWLLTLGAVVVLYPFCSMLMVSLTNTPLDSILFVTRRQEATTRF